MKERDTAWEWELARRCDVVVTMSVVDDTAVGDDVLTTSSEREIAS